MADRQKPVFRLIRTQGNAHKPSVITITHPTIKHAKLCRYLVHMKMGKSNSHPLLVGRATGVVIVETCIPWDQGSFPMDIPLRNLHKRAGFIAALSTMRQIEEKTQISPNSGNGNIAE